MEWRGFLVEGATKMEFSSKREMGNALHRVFLTLFVEIEVSSFFFFFFF